MPNPFEALGKPAMPKGEEVTGVFSCQSHPCDRVAKTALYIKEVKLLTWKCPDGHVSSMEYDL